MKDSEVARAAEIKSCFLFTISGGSAGQQGRRPFRDPFGPYFLAQVGEKLRAEGFHVTEAKPGKACDAGFDVSQSGFGVTVVLLIGCHADANECALLTWCIRPWLRRVPAEAASAGWNRVCTSIDRILRESLRITGVLWLTHQEASQRLASFRGSP
jgi:hypothetical protein